MAAFAFNDAPYPAPPWHGFTLDWFLGDESSGRVGLFHDSELLDSILTSALVADKRNRSISSLIDASFSM